MEETVHDVDVVEDPNHPDRTWGVAVVDVLDLVPTVGVLPQREPSIVENQSPDPWSARTPEKGISEAMVERYIALVGSRVSARLVRAEAVPATSPFAESLRQAAADSVTNGAASYVYAAAAPEKAGLSDTTAYSEVLWRRHLDSLELAATALAEWIDSDEGGEDDGSHRRGKPSGSFPPARFHDDQRW